MHDLPMAFLTVPMTWCLCAGLLSFVFLAVTLLLLVTVTLIALPPLMEVRKRLPSRVNTMAYVSLASGFLGYLLMMWGVALAISSWLGSAMFIVGLALFLCFLVGMSVVMYRVRRLL